MIITTNIKIEGEDLTEEEVFNSLENWRKVYYLDKRVYINVSGRGGTLKNDS